VKTPIAIPTEISKTISSTKVVGYSGGILSRIWHRPDEFNSQDVDKRGGLQ